MGVQIVSGNDGDFQINGVPVATVAMWGMSRETAGILIPNFSSPVDDDANVWPEIIPGYSTGEIQVEGQMNTDPVDATDGVVVGLSNGLYVIMNLILVKGTPWGYNDVVGLVTNFRPGTTIENQAAKFTCTIKTSGIVPRSGVIS